MNISGYCPEPTIFCVENTTIIRYAQVRIFRQLENQHNFWNRLTFLNKHLILSRSLKKPFRGNCVKISDCRAFSLFKTSPGCRVYSHSEKYNDILKIPRIPINISGPGNRALVLVMLYVADNNNSS